MARNFDGTNDNLVVPDNTVPALDADDLLMGTWMQKAVQPSGNQFAYLTMTLNGGLGRAAIRVNAPAVSGYRVNWVYVFSASSGIWETGDIALDTRQHIAVTYNRSLATNDPLVYINAVSVSLTETTTPSVTPNTGGDTIKSGEGPTGAADFEGTMSHQVAHGGVAFDAADVNRMMWWGRPRGGLHFYQPLVTDKLTNEGSETGATYTATGTTVVEFAAPTVRPGSAMMGMGIGW
jgi:hypothetical protein